MKPESITVSLEMAKKLQESGWMANPTIFSWGKTMEGEWTILKPGTEWFLTGFEHYCEGIMEGKPIELKDHLAAPTAEEILRELPPHRIDAKKNGDVVGYDLYCKQCFGVDAMEGRWKVWYFRFRDGCELAPLGMPQYADTLANAAAEMWIYLKENNLLKDA